MTEQVLNKEGYVDAPMPYSGYNNGSKEGLDAMKSHEHHAMAGEHLNLASRFSSPHNDPEYHALRQAAYQAIMDIADYHMKRAK